MYTKLVIMVLLVLLPTTAATQGNYVIEIGDSPTLVWGASIDVPITLEWVGAGTPDALAAFDLTIAYEYPENLILEDIRGGQFLTDAGWGSLQEGILRAETSCQPGGGIIYTQQIIAFASAAPITAPPPGQKVELAVFTFRAPNCPGTEGFSPISFYWLPGTTLDPDRPCRQNLLSSTDGYTIYGAASSFDAQGVPFDPGVNCSGPPVECDAPVRNVDFHSSGINVVYAESTNRGDLNLNDLKYEISDRLVYVNYNLKGASALSPDPATLAQQILASDVNCDGTGLTISDLVYMIRVMNCVTAPCTSGPTLVSTQSPEKTPTGNLMAFYGGSGSDGDRNVPLVFHTTNDVRLGALLGRVEFDPNYITPVPNPNGAPGAVKFQLTSRSSDWVAGGGFARSSEPGVLVFGLVPTGANPYPEVPVGSGPIIQVLFDVNVPPPPTLDAILVDFVDEFEFSHWSTTNGTLIIPATAGAEFDITGPPPPPPPPSCPVLYSYNGEDFGKENTLLTACENGGYVDVVTDYYQVTGPVASEDGRVRFQFREGEDEITYLHSVRLLVVDHEPGTRVATTVDGRVFTYADMVRPIAATDNLGVDRLVNVVAEDGDYFVAEESGYLVVEFPGGKGGFDINAAGKGLHLPPGGDNVSGQTGPNVLPPPALLTVEYRDVNDAWVPFSAVPPRDVASHEFLYTDALPDGATTIRISWAGGYATDAIRRFTPSADAPVINEYAVGEVDLKSSGLSKPSESGAIVLRKGDVAEFSFDIRAKTLARLERDYVVVATGRYEPDYRVYPDMVPERFRLLDNYPNPFNPLTTIAFTAPMATAYQIGIYNVVGQRVAVFEGIASPGVVRVDWDASGLASGVYVYRLTAGNFTDTRKMILLK